MSLLTSIGFRIIFFGITQDSFSSAFFLQSIICPDGRGSFEGPITFTFGLEKNNFDDTYITFIRTYTDNTYILVSITY